MRWFASRKTLATKHVPYWQGLDFVQYARVTIAGSAQVCSLRPLNTRSPKRHAISSPPRTALVQSFKRHLNGWGYSADLVIEDFSFGQDGKNGRAALAAFARLPADARTACIAVVDVRGSAAVEVAECRELGAPVVFACTDDGISWWKQGAVRPEFWESIAAEDLDDFARRHRDHQTFDPLGLYRAKTQSRINQQLRLPFVDELLIPTVERAVGHRLGVVIDNVFVDLKRRLGPRELKPAVAHQLLKDAFWLLAAKILHDKEVPSFAGLDLTNARDVFKRIREHYREPEQLHHQKKEHLAALSSAAPQVIQLGHLGQVTTEALAYVYENTLVTDELRQTLGIHSTPPYLTDYVLGRLQARIGQIPEAERHVFEPASGHGAFLVAAMRQLRDMYTGSGNAHDYLKQHLHGLEIDATAREIARLSLTLADVPNPDGWLLYDGDMFDGDRLGSLTAQANILLANPPFEDFTSEELARYERTKTPATHDNKAEEMLIRTLSRLPRDAVFGLVVPQTVLRSKSGREIRRLIARDFALDEVLILPDKVFAFADVEAAILIGHRTSVVEDHVVRYRRVRDRQEDIDKFRVEYFAKSDRRIAQSELATEPNFDLRLPELHEVWVRGQGRTLADIAEVGLGLQHHNADYLDKKGLQAWSARKFAGAARGYVNVGRNLRIHGAPEEVWVNIGSDAVSVARAGTTIGRPQVLVNHRPTDRGPWRLKAVLDREGHVTRDVFIVVRPRGPELPLELIWALCNSSYANAYAYANATKRDINPGVLKGMPVPRWTDADRNQLVSYAKAYINAAGSFELGPLWGGVGDQVCRTLLRRIDALVLRLYNLPSRLERQIVDVVDDAEGERSGVAYPWARYMPEGFPRKIPLYVYLATHDPELAHVMAVQSFDESSALESLKRLTTAQLDGEIDLIYEELASLDNFRGDAGSTEALECRATTLRRRLLQLQEEGAHRVPDVLTTGGFELIAQAVNLLEKYGYTPDADTTIPAADSKKS